MASAVWLGLYLVSQSPRHKVTWLAALTLWSIGGVFLADLIDVMRASTGLPKAVQQSFSVWPCAAAVFWFHATSLMRPSGLTPWRRVILIGSYPAAVFAILVELLRPDWLVVSGPDSLSLADNQVGPLFAPFAVGLMLLILLSVTHLIESARAARLEILRRQFGLLVVSTVLAGLAGPISILSSGFGVPFRTLANAATLLAGVLLLGYGVAQYSAILEGRTIRRHLANSAAAVGGVTLLYLGVAQVSALSFGTGTETYLFLILLAVVTHSLVGSARSALDAFFFQPYTRAARRSLRRLINEAAEEYSLSNRLSLELDYICTEVRATFGLVLRIDDGVQVLAGYRWTGPPSLSLERTILTPDDVFVVPPGSLAPPLDAAALVAPLWLDAENIGAVLLGHPVNGTAYAPDRIELIAYASDRMVDLIREDRARASHLEPLSRLSEGAGAAPAFRVAELSTLEVETALRNLHNYAYLGGHRLSESAIVDSRVPEGTTTHVDRGRITHQILVECIEKFRPADAKPIRGSPREWHAYLILHDAYVEDRSNRDVMSDLAISEGTFNRRRRDAVRALTRLLQEWERRETAGMPAT